MPRLVTYAGRTEEGLDDLLEEVAVTKAENVEMQALLQQSAGASVITHPCRGFAIANGSNKVKHVEVGACGCTFYLSHLFISFVICRLSDPQFINGFLAS